MTDTFEVNAPGIDTEQLVKDIQETVDRKMKAGVYSDARIARAEKSNLVNLRDEDEFLSYYLQCLRDSASVDMSDFEIRESRQSLAFLLIRLKRTIWKLLKFYTYRMWSQQNEVNGLLVTAIEGLDQRQARKIKELESRVRQLEQQAGNKGT